MSRRIPLKDYYCAIMEQHINLQAYTDRSVCDWNIFQDNDLFYVAGCTVQCIYCICAHYLSVKQNAPCFWFYCLPIFWSVCNCMLCSTKSVCQWSRFSICTTTSIHFQLFATNLFRMLYYAKTSEWRTNSIRLTVIVYSNHSRIISTKEDVLAKFCRF